MRAPDVSAFLPPSAERIVFFGSEVGQTAEHFSRIHPGASFLAGAGKEDPLRGGADCILYTGEAAARLTAEELRAHAAHLAEDGQVLLVAENPGYVRRLMATLSGAEWKGAEGRFPADVLRLAREAGLVAHSACPIFAEEDEEERQRITTQRLLAALAAWRKETGCREGSDPWAVRQVFRLSRKERIPLLLHSFLGESLVTARPRILEPHAFLSTVPGVLCRNDLKEQSVLDRSIPRKILFWQRKVFGGIADGLRSLRRIRELGYLGIAEIDDNPSRWKERYEADHYLDFRGMHAVQVSTEPLAEILRQYNPEVRVFPNMLRELPPRKEFREDGTVTIFFGALNREGEWKDILPVLNALSREYGEKLRFRVLSDRLFFDHLETKHKEYVGREDFYEGRYVPYEVYLDTMRSADISLLPLVDTEFNRTKSDLKFIESAANGAVVLASPTVYRKTVRDGETGFIYRSPQEFVGRLRLLIEHPEKRRAMAEAAYRYVAGERMLYQHYEERLDWYEELLARKDELDLALDKRLAQVEAFNR